MATLSPRLVARGPVTNALQRFHLIRGNPNDVPREILTWLAIAWIPFLVLAGVQAALGLPLEPLFLDPQAHVRFAVALPLLVLGRRIIDVRCERALGSLEDLGTMEPRDRPALDRAIRALLRACGSPGVEAVLLAIALASGLAGMAGDPRVGGGTLWYALVSLPVYRYLLALALFRWLAWFVFLLRVSRIRLGLKAAHPDRAGGLEFLARPTLGIATVVAGMESTVVASWIAPTVRASSMKPFIPVLLTVLGAALLLAFGPLVAFCKQMVRARLRALLTYGRLALRYVRFFEDKHLAGGAGPGPEERAPDLLGSPDIQSLADLGGAFDVIRGMRVVPFDRRAVALVLVTAAAPAAALALSATPTSAILLRIARTVIGVP